MPSNGTSIRSFIAVTGGSAGGHLAALMGLTANDPEYQPGFEEADTRVQAAVPIYGVYDFTSRLGTNRLPFWYRRLERQIMKAFRDEEPEKFRRASPIERIHPRRAAVLRDSRRPRHPRTGRRGPPVRRCAPRGFESARRLRRARRRTARVRPLLLALGPHTCSPPSCSSSTPARASRRASTLRRAVTR